MEGCLLGSLDCETTLVVLGDLERKLDCDGNLLGSLDPLLGPVLGELKKGALG